MCLPVIEVTSEYKLDLVSSRLHFLRIVSQVRTFSNSEGVLRDDCVERSVSSMKKIKESCYVFA